MHIVPDYTASEEVLQCAFRNDLINLDRAVRPGSESVVVCRSPAVGRKPQQPTTE